MDSTTIIICEKPSVAAEYCKCIELTNEVKKEGYREGDSKVLGGHYIVTWTVGHLIALSYPEKYDENLKIWKYDTLPFLPSTFKYEVISNVAKQFKIIKELYHSASTSAIFYAGDSGREGIYIQMLVRQIAGTKKGIDEKVVWIDSQTKEEILRGIAEAKPISAYKGLIEAGYARAQEDFLLGINFSRILSLKHGAKLQNLTGKKETVAVGRVMTAVLGMCVRREREIKNFKQSFYYGIKANAFERDLTWKPSDEMKESPLMYNEKGFRNKTDADALAGKLNSNPKLTVKSIEVKDKKKGAPLLFNLAELQFWCSKKYHLSPSDTLTVAQSLYEKKVTTYPRTDARVITTAVAKEITKNLKGLTTGSVHEDVAASILKRGSGIEDYLIQSPYVDDKKVTDHYAIIPTGLHVDLSGVEAEVYKDIVERFLAIFLPPAVFEEGKMLAVHPTGELFSASAKTLKVPGYLVLYGGASAATEGEGDEEEKVGAGENPLKAYKPGDVSSAKFIVCERKTEPPKRYTTGSMILAMENAGKLIEEEELREQIKSCGIGTSATRAETIKKLIEKCEYLSLNKKTQIIKPTPKGELVFDIVNDCIPSLLKAEMTASWEKGLSGIESGTTPYNLYMGKINEYITNVVEKVKAQEGSIATNVVKGVEVAYNCPLCGKGRVVKRKVKTKFGDKLVYGCSQFKDEGCSFSLWATINGKDLTDSQVKHLLTLGHTGVVKIPKKSGEIMDVVLKMKPTGEIEYDFDFQKKKSSKSS